jgi:hypothetical protein
MPGGRIVVHGNALVGTGAFVGDKGARGKMDQQAIVPVGWIGKGFRRVDRLVCGADHRSGMCRWWCGSLGWSRRWFRRGSWLRPHCFLLLGGCRRPGYSRCRRIHWGLRGAHNSMLGRGLRLRCQMQHMSQAYTADAQHSCRYDAPCSQESNRAPAPFVHGSAGV